MNLGVPEILLLLVLAVLFFGARRLPELGKSLGEGIKNFRQSMNEASKDEKKP
ncbi:MAG: twin-arginine translocase TatA/TatE family subunit [Candidatus Polarisedimenticolia bacterium]|nr:twin-arginine translocase TatA/TatE family subunit [bacterium]